MRAVARQQAQINERQQDKTPFVGASAEEKAIKAVAQNLLVMSTPILDDETNCRLVKRIHSAANPTPCNQR